MRLANQWHYHRGEWKPVDYVWPDEPDDDEESLRALGFRLRCRLGTELTNECGLEAWVWERTSRTNRRFGSAQYLIQVALAGEVHFLFATDFPDLVELLAKVEPIVRASVRTELLYQLQEQRAALQASLAELDQLDSGPGWVITEHQGALMGLLGAQAEAPRDAAQLETAATAQAA